MLHYMHQFDAHVEDYRNKNVEDLRNVLKEAMTNISEINKKFNHLFGMDNDSKD